MGDKSDQPAARLGDIAGNHGPWPPTPIIVGSGNVLINGLPAARQGDAALLHAIPNNPPHGRSIAEGSGSVLINGKPAARTTDAISCGGQILSGSGNVLIGDNPTLVQPVKVDIPKLEIPTIDFGKQNTKLAKVRTPVSSTPASSSPLNSGTSSATTNSQAVSSDTNASQANASEANTSEANSSDAINTSSFLQTNQQAAIDYWQDQKDQAENFPAYLAAHLMCLNAETGYSIAEGLVATYDLVTDPSALADALAGLKDSIVNTVTDPIGTYNDIKQAAEEFAELPLSEQGETLYKASLEILAGGASVKSAAALASVTGKVSDAATQLLKLNTAALKVEVTSLPEAQAQLANRRAQIAEEGYTPKYSDDELAYLAQNGDIGNERFQVRFMEAKYLSSRDNPSGHLSGAMGTTMEGATGKGAKYWSTSFDQLEDKDTDPKLIAESLGIEYNPNTDYVLVIVDTDVATPLTGAKGVSATFENISEFANTELPEDFPKSFTDKAMTPEFQAEYAAHYQAAVEQGYLENMWSRNTEDFEDYLLSVGMDRYKIDEMKLRMKMHDKIGNNQDYLGNGLTKNLNTASTNNSGVVETLNFERTEVDLNQLHSAGAISIVTGLTPL